jgi:hypothetical protein
MQPYPHPIPALEIPWLIKNNAKKFEIERNFLLTFAIGCMKMLTSGKGFDLQYPIYVKSLVRISNRNKSIRMRWFTKPCH